MADDSEAIRLTGADEWLMNAVRAAGGANGATLKDVITAGDMINHAVFTPTELRTGFAKLLAAGWVTEKDGKWFVREGGRTVRVIGESNVWPDPNTPDPRWNHPLSDEEISAAVRAYQEDADRILQRIEKKKKKGR